MRGRWLLAAAPLAAGLAAPLSGQVAPNHAVSYLHPTDVRDARAVWVNPAGLAILREASVYAELVAGNPGPKGRLRQFSAGFNARGLSLAYQRDLFDNGARANTYRLGLAGASAGLAAGVAVARYGGADATGWDFGVSYAWRPALTVGGVLANIGQPMVRGVEQRFTYIPGITWRPLGPAAALSVHARVTPDAVAGYGFGVSWQGRGGERGARWPVGALLRLDTDGGLRRAAFALGVSVGGPDRVGVVLSTPGDVSGVDAAGLYGVSAREATSRRRP